MKICVNKQLLDTFSAPGKFSSCHGVLPIPRLQQFPIFNFNFFDVHIDGWQSDAQRTIIAW